MVEGKIIQFYRVLHNLKQSELGEGICSATHISKIERGLTEVSQNTINLLSARLNINMEAEINTYINLEQWLQEWFQSIIFKINVKADKLKEQLENTPLLKIPDFYRFYTLILTRYYLFSNNEKLAKRYLVETESYKNLRPYEENMRLHTSAIYQLKFKNNFEEAISILKRIDIKQYNNPEFFYDLGIAYHSINSRVLAYHYVNKALQYFSENRCFSRLIECEILMLIQLEETDEHVSSEEEYQRLIEMTLEYGLDHQRAVLLHNFAYKTLRKGNFEEASKYYDSSMDLRDKQTFNYLCSFEGYLNSLIKGSLMPKETLLKLAEEGLRLAEKLESTMYIHIFKLHQFTIQGLNEQYFQYLEKVAFPYYKKVGISQVIEHYQLKLFDYYTDRQQIEKANTYAKAVLEKYRKNNQFV